MPEDQAQLFNALRHTKLGLEIAFAQIATRAISNNVRMRETHN